VPPLPRALRAAAGAPTVLAETLFLFSAAAQLQRQHREGKLLSNRDALDQLRLLGVERIECLRVYGQARARCAAFRVCAVVSSCRGKAHSFAVAITKCDTRYV
jgi:hypothetical protein